MISLAATVLTASLAFAQSATTPADTTPDTPAATSETAPVDAQNNNATMGTTTTTTTDDAAGAASSTTMSDQTTTTTTGATAYDNTPAAATTDRDDRGIGSTLAWLIPLLIVLALAVPFVRRWTASRRHEMPVGPRV
jgi:cobalamin biosynthesis Mg chelatase CobN